MNKRGMEGDPYSDLFFSFIIFGLAIIITYVITSNMEAAPKVYLQAKELKLHNEEVFIQYLNTKISDDKDLYDIIIETHGSIIPDKTQLKKEMDNLVLMTFSKKMCWSLFVEDKRFVSGDVCISSESPTINASAIVPTRDGPIKLGMVISE